MYSPMRESLKDNRKSLLLSEQENPGTAGVSNGNCGENNSCLNISEIKNIFKDKNVRDTSLLVDSSISLLYVKH